MQKVGWLCGEVVIFGTGEEGDRGGRKACFLGGLMVWVVKCRMRN